MRLAYTSIASALLHFVHDRPSIPRLSAIVTTTLGVYGRIEVDIKGEDVKTEDEGNDPL